MLQLLPGIGPSFAGQAIEALDASLDPARAIAALRTPSRAEADWPPFVDMFSGLRARRGNWPSDVEFVRLWYEPHLERIHEDAAGRRADLMQLEQIAAGYASRQQFLTELTLDPPRQAATRPALPHLDEDYLILSTIHSAKGQEWTKVFVLNAVDGCIPSDLATGEREEIEEERRLLYVAMTRAKDSLHIVTPQRFYTHGQAARGDRHVYASRTRFIPTAILAPVRGLRLAGGGDGIRGPGIFGPGVDAAGRHFGARSPALALRDGGTGEPRGRGFAGLPGGWSESWKVSRNNQVRKCVPPGQDPEQIRSALKI